MAQLKVKQIAGIQAYIQNLIDTDADQNAGLIADLEASVDSLESALSQEILDLGAGADASIDSLESALSSEIFTTGNEIDALDDSVDSLESALSTEIVTTGSEIKDLQDHDGYLDNSVDSLESALSTHMAAIYAIADDSDGVLENFSEVVNFVVSVDEITDGMVTDLTNYLGSSVEHLQDSVDSLESALSTEIVTTGNEVGAIDNSIDSLESALSTEIFTTGTEVDALDDSVDSLESALSTEIVTTGDEIDAIDASINSLETQVDEIEAAGMRVHQFGAVAANAFTLPLAVDVSADSDIVVFVNGKNEMMAATNGASGGWASADGVNFTFAGLGYNVDATDEVYVVAPLAGTGSGSGQGTNGGDWEPYNPEIDR